MKKTLILLLPLSLLLSGCSGLPTAREMGDMALLRTMGVDVSPAGVAVTGSTGLQSAGRQAGEEAVLTLAADRESLSGACLAMQGQSDSYVFFGYVDQLLLGQELAERGVRPVLDYFARDSQLGLGAQLWLVQGAAAREALSSGGEKGADSRLENLRHDSEMGIANLTRTAGEVYADLLELGSAFVPAIAPVPGGEAVLTERGYGVLKGETLAGFLEDEEAKGLELLYGGPSADSLDVELPGQKISVKVTSARTRSRLEFQGDEPVELTLACKIEVRLSEYERLLTAAERERLCGELEARERERMEGALERLRAWGADCAGLGAKAGIAHPVRWPAIQAEWPAWFSRVPVEIQVRIALL